MILKNSAILVLISAIRELDKGYPSQENAAMLKPYALTGKTRWILAKDLGILCRAFDPVNTTREGLVAQLSPDGTPEAIDKDSELLKKFLTQYNSVLAHEVDLPGLLQFPVTELTTNNVVPIDLLQRLEKILGDENP
jgi:hypothetical protein